MFMSNKKSEHIGELISKAKALAKEYRQLTGKPLGITGEVAEYEAARLLGLELSDARQPGYDAIRRQGDKIIKVQIKGRRLSSDSKSSQRLGSIRLEHDWDTVVLVILDEEFNPVELYEAEKKDIEEALLKPGSKARNERGALAMSKFKSISKLVWSRD